MSRIFQSIIIAFIGALLIAISAFSVVELASRISAKSFVLSKIDNIEKNAFNNSSDENKAEKSKKLAKLSGLKVILDDIDHLAVSGAETPRQTIHAIRQRINEQNTAESIRLDVQAKNNTLGLLNSELTALRSNGIIVASQLDDISNQLRNEADKEIKSILKNKETNNSRSISNKGATVNQLQRNFKDLTSTLNDNNAQVEIITKKIEQINDEIRVINQNKFSWEPGNILRYNYIFYLQSDMILAISIVLCGGIGAIFTASRSAKPKFSKAVFNGLMAGFIAFLIIKGGRSFFLVNLNFANSPSINPYAAAFSGILAGLFTEKAYQLLSNVTDKLTEKVLDAENTRK